MAEFPDVTGFSKRNLEQIRSWYLFWSEKSRIAKQPASQKIAQQPVSQFKNEKGKQVVALITQIPWGHNLIIISKCKTKKEALFYTKKLPDELKSALPDIKEIEAELNMISDD